MKFLCALCLLCAPGLLVAQSLPEADPVMMESETPFAETSPGFPATRRVAVIPFLGDIEGITGVPEITARILEVLGRAVAVIALYEPVMVRLPAGASLPSADSPPPRALTGDAKYALCGELLTDEGKYHFQLWLWDMDATQLVYTDELVCEEFDEGIELLSAMVGWLFSHISQTGKVPGRVPDEFLISSHIGLYCVFKQGAMDFGILFSDPRYSQNFGATKANGPVNTYSYSQGDVFFFYWV
jgi:hypothetical protein